MNRFIASALVFTLSLVSGCGDKGTPGGPGAKNPPNSKDAPMVGTADSTFTIDVPNLSTTIDQGETKEIGIAINRGKNFDQNVTLKLETLPAGLTASPASPTIMTGNKEVKINLTAAADAIPGDYVIRVVGKPVTGVDARNEFKVKIAKP